MRALLTPLGQRLLTRLDPTEIDADPLGAATRLRRDPELTGATSQVPVTDLVNAALTQARLRGRAREKFGAAAERMYFTPNGLEQATRRVVARYRARRFAATVPASPDLPVGDLCCGIGADLISMAEAGLPVEGVDLDPFTIEVARANIEAFGLTDRARVREGDVTQVKPGSYAGVFCDPARRSGRGRVFNPHAYSPPWPSVLELVGGAPAACVKVAPGIPHDLVPEGVTAEWVSVDGEVKEAALWFGASADAGTPRRATLLRARGGQEDPEPIILEPDPGLGAPEVRAPGRYLYEPDGAVIRAHLVAEAAAAVDGALLDPNIAYITSDRLVPTPLCRAYEITDVLPFSVKRLRSALRSRDVGTVTIKKRGSAVDVERLRRDLRPSGSRSAVVVLTRIGERPVCLLCDEVEAPREPEGA
ncbi:class I SAM-dependent methyltransferase [Marinactinospora thermotolerans]|uniref:class I SAM-dependent methyltransferase n=1 Tax=Marinactinospora thermotolerans TaxID=531310 RepID=UPI001F47782F|nr:class I SAM-dependent methyltransferase [Marinactinospora thermotolerans]